MLLMILSAQKTGNDAALMVSSTGIGLRISQARTRMAQAYTPRARIWAYGNMERQQPHIIKEILFMVVLLGIAKFSRCSAVLICWISDWVTALKRLVVKEKSRYNLAVAEGKQYRILVNGC